MSGKPFKFRRVNEIAAAFVLILVILLSVLIAVSGKLQGWFEKSEIFEVSLMGLKDETKSGIRAGTEVRILGTRVGLVRKVELRERNRKEELDNFKGVSPDEIQLWAILKVRGDRLAFIGSDSKLLVKKDLGGFGASYLEITPGSGMWSDTSALLVMEPEQDLLKNFGEPVQKAVENATTVLGNIGDPDSDMSVSIAKFKEILISIDEAMDNGQGTLGLVIGEEEKENLNALVNDSREIVESIKNSIETSEGVLKVVLGEKGSKSILEMLEAMKEETDYLISLQDDLNSIIADGKAAMAELPAIVRTTDESVKEFYKATQLLMDGLREYTEVAEAAQRHWLLNKYVEDGAGDANPENMRSVDAGADEKRPRSGIFRRRK